MNKTVTLVFDLDGTVINSAHRTPNKADGTLDLQGYIARHSIDNVFKDTLLPLANVMKDAIAKGYSVAVLTARDMAWFDYAYLSAQGIMPDWIFSRDKATPEHYKMSDGQYKLHWLAKMPQHMRDGHVVMFDDSAPVKAAMRSVGVACLCAHRVNRLLYKQARGK